MSKLPPIECPADMRGSLWTTKDLARYMVLSPRRVKSWWKRLEVPPDLCAATGLHRWSWKQVKRLLTKWRNYRKAQGMGEDYAAKVRGDFKRQRERGQIRLPLRW